ncbi:MAG: 3-keto-disaccharide hydrolase [Verrucomicrobiales bacterium]
MTWFAVILCLLLPSLAPAGEIFVGTAETSITPDRPVALEGAFRLRISDGVESPVTAGVVVLESRDGETLLERSIMISADLVHLPIEMVKKVRARVGEQVAGIDASKIFISTTHTHQAPVVMRGNFIIPEGVMTIGEYIDFFAERVSAAVVEALGNVERGSVAWGLGDALVAYNRRAAYADGRSAMYGDVGKSNFKGPEGAEYQGVPTLFFFDAKGKPLAVAVNVWSPSQESFGGNKISADFWHPVRQRLKTALDKELVVLGWCGAAGDQGPIRRFHSEAEDRMRRLRGEASWVDELGRRIADSVIDTYSLVCEERHADAAHAHVSEVIPLPGWILEPDRVASIRRERDDLAERLADDPSAAVSLARPISWRTQTIERQSDFANGDGTYPSEIHVLRIGDVAIATNQFELFTEYGLRILGRSDAHMTCVVQLVGPAYYLPTKEAVAGGGYSAVPESCAVGPEGGAALVDETVARINKLFYDLEVTLPEEGQLADGEPVGDGWEKLLGDRDGWSFEKEHWTLEDGVLSGASEGGDYHFAWTKGKTYRDFELHAVVRMTGRGANSGVGIRLNPTGHASAPGYQLDMGPGHWGCLWDEGGDGMVEAFPAKGARKLVRDGDWNHYFIVAKGHHVQAWLNGVQTVDIKHEGGPLEGALGFELCHGRKQTNLEVKTLAVRELK